MTIPETPSDSDLNFLRVSSEPKRNPFDEPQTVIGSRSQQTPQKADSGLSASGASGNPPTSDTHGACESPEPGDFPLKALPELIRNMVMHVAASASIPISLHALAALSVLSATFGKKFMTKVTDQRYPTPCNLMVVLSASTTIGKSILRAYVEAFLEYDQSLRIEHERTLGKRTLDHDLLKKRYEKFKDKIVSMKLTGGDSSLLEAEAEELAN